MTRAELVAAALERLAMCNRTSLADAAICEEAARLLRESQPEPALDYLGNAIGEEPSGSQPAPVVGDDEALLNVLDAIETKLASTEQYELAIGCQSVATRLRAALSDLARLEARPSRYEDLMAIEQLQVQVDHYRTGMTEARAALAAAVAEEDEQTALLDDARSVLTNSANYTSGFDPVLKMARAYYSSKDRARAGRNDG